MNDGLRKPSNRPPTRELLEIAGIYNYSVLSGPAGPGAVDHYAKTITDGELHRMAQAARAAQDKR